MSAGLFSLILPTKSALIGHELRLVEGHFAL